MTEPNGDIFFHKQKLQEVCEGLKHGKDYLLMGPFGIGKSRFLKNIVPYWRNRCAESERVVVFWFVDFKLRRLYELARICPTQHNSTADESVEVTGNQFQEQLLRKLKESVGDSTQELSVLLMDNLDEAIADRETYSLDFFLKLFDVLADLKDHPTPRYVISCPESPWKLLRHTYSEEQPRPHKLLTPNSIWLGLVSEAEADSFVREAGGTSKWKEDMPWLNQHVEAIREIAGRYPLFLERAVQELHTNFSNVPDLDLERFKNHYQSAVSEMFQSVWTARTPEEKALFCKLSNGKQPSEGPERMLFKGSLKPLAIVTADGKIFSIAFGKFIFGTREYKEHAEVQKEKTRPFLRNKANVTYLILALFILFPVAVLLTLPRLRDPVWILWAIFAFVVVFTILMGLYLFSQH